MALASAGDIVLFKFPQTDLSVGKLRPALVVAAVPSRFDDWLVCMISTQTQQAIPQFDETIDAADSDFRMSGLKVTSLIRATRVAIASETIFVGQTRRYLRIGWKVFERKLRNGSWRLTRKRRSRNPSAA